MGKVNAQLPQGVTLRSDGRYMARFKFEGERYTFYGKNPKALAKKMQDKRYELEHGFYCKESDITINDWFNVWLKDYKENAVKQGTIEAYDQNFRLYIKPTLGNKKLSQIRAEHVQRLLNTMAEGHSPSTIKLSYVILNGMYKQAVKNRLVKDNPVNVATVPRQKQKKKIRVMSVDEQRLFLQFAEKSPYYDLYMVALGTGMRLGELRGLMWKDVDFKNQIIHVDRTMRYFHGKGTMLDSPKTERSNREIPMLDKVCTILKKHKVQQKKQKLFLGDMWKPDFSDLVFTNPWGRHVSDTAINSDMKKIEEQIRAAGYEFEHIYPHVLRHTFATRGLESGIKPKVMQEILGHTSISMTLDIYSHVLPDTKAKELQKMSGLY